MQKTNVNIARWIEAGFNLYKNNFTTLVLAALIALVLSTVTIGILTGGGDVPGLNPAIRAVTIRAIREGYRVIGLRRGWAGIVEVERDEKADNSLSHQVLTEEIVRYGGVRRSYIGFYLQDVTPSVAQAMKLGSTDGALVTQVDKGSPAAEVGLEPGAIINVGSGDRVTVLELYRAMARLCGSTAEPRMAPPRAGDVLHSLASLDRAREMLGYEPAIGWREGLEATVGWYRERFGAPRD